MTLFDSLKKAGVQYANHETDLYFPKTEETEEILKRYPVEHKNATTFRNQVEGGVWYDVPFAYAPAWDRLL